MKFTRRFQRRSVLIIVLAFLFLVAPGQFNFARTESVYVDGYTLRDDQGPFLGLGVSYFYAFGDYPDDNHRW